MEENKKKRGRPRYENTDRILKAQDVYYETRDISVLWKIYPDLEHAVRSLLYKRFNNNVPDYFVQGYFQNIVDDITLHYLEYFVYRAAKGLPKIKSPISYAHYMIQYFYPKDDALINTGVPYEETLENVLAAEYDYDIGKEHDIAILYKPRSLKAMLNAYELANQVIVILKPEQAEDTKLIDIMHKYFPFAILYRETDNVEKKLREELPVKASIIWCKEYVTDASSKIFDTVWLGVSPE